MKQFIHLLKLNRMKNLLLLLFITVGFAACKSEPDFSSENSNIRLLPNSTEFTNNALSDTNTVAAAEITPAKVAEKPRTIVKTIIIREAAPRAKSVEVAPVTTSTTPTATASIPPIVDNPVSTSTGSDKNDSSVGNSTETASAPAEKTVKKPGMNKATEGAIIGGVAGAVGGAVISKKKGLGAVVGAVAGAAGGYIIGKKLDKKSNQYVID